MADDICRTHAPGVYLLRRLRVRPIRPEERRRWDALVDQYHYLSRPSLNSMALRYVALCDER